MRRTIRSRRAVAVLIVLLLAPRLQAADTVAARPSSVRTAVADLRPTLANGIALSATFRSLVDRINRSDLVVYVQCGLFTETRLLGRLLFLSSVVNQRFVVIQIKCLQTQDALIVTLAHELQHAVEVAEVQSVIDAASMARLYAGIGELVSDNPGATAYETTAALTSARRVHRELLDADRTRVMDY